MTLKNLAAASVLAGATLVLTACGGTESTVADEAAIRKTNETLLEKVAARDTAAVAGLYAEDAQMLPPNAPKAVGRAAIEETWKALLAPADLKLSTKIETLTFARSGEMAVEVGTYTLSMGDGASDTGKSVVTWIRRNGKWQILTDMFSSDAPMAAPAPTEAAAPTEPTTPADGSTPADATTPPAEPAAPATPPAN